MIKYLLLFSLIFLSNVCSVNGGDSEKLMELKKERGKLSLEMHNRRIELIKEDPELQEMHKKIMDLHKELANQLDRHEKMCELVEKAKKLDIEIDSLTKELKEKAEEEQ